MLSRHAVLAEIEREILKTARTFNLRIKRAGRSCYDLCLPIALGMPDHGIADHPLVGTRQAMSRACPWYCMQSIAGLPRTGLSRSSGSFRLACP